MTDNTQAEPSTTPDSTKRIPDKQRLMQVAKVHGLAFLAAITLCAAADNWAIQTGLVLAQVISVANAFAAAIILASLFHEWGHFTGARIAGSYSPLVTNPFNQFIFGFNFSKNTSKQFLSMSFGGPLGNIVLLMLTVLLLPLDTAGRVTFFAVVVAKAIAVIIFEGPIIMRVIAGQDPESSLQDGLNDGSGDRGEVIGYGIGALIWLLAL